MHTRRKAPPVPLHRERLLSGPEQLFGGPPPSDAPDGDLFNDPSPLPAMERHNRETIAAALARDGVVAAHPRPGGCLCPERLPAVNVPVVKVHPHARQCQQHFRRRPMLRPGLWGEDSILKTGRLRHGNRAHALHPIDARVDWHKHCRPADGFLHPLKGGATLIPE